jgi:hypothetical protein
MCNAKNIQILVYANMWLYACNIQGNICERHNALYMYIMELYTFNTQRKNMYTCIYIKNMTPSSSVFFEVFFLVV